MQREWREDQWIGVQETAFAAYRQWKTPSGYLCGTYAAAVLLAYYQDHLGSASIPLTIRKPFESNEEPLVTALKQRIQPSGLPTVPLQVAHGINRFLTEHQATQRVRITLIGAWPRVTKRLRQGKPVMIGILGWLGSTYGNHWVIAYAYQQTADGKRYYKVHDNWGSYNKVIPAEWANGTVSFP